MNDTACVSALAHVAIKADDLDTTIAFYERVLGLRQVSRPPFPFPGAWLGPDEDNAIVHLYGGSRAQEAGGGYARGTGRVDHVSFWARGYLAQCERFARFGLPYRDQRPPQTTLAQLFVYDPNGVLLELTYDLRREPGAPAAARGGEARFEPARYAQFAAR
ncbi:MAG: VOC family protein [Burkholderiaceae bacterium]|nr:VOC family protein [Burkholderiaceae bacterium]MCX8004803.1 VOC family protein [Burkholderiaceae bacterium]